MQLLDKIPKPIRYPILGTIPLMLFGFVGLILYGIFYLVYYVIPWGAMIGVVLSPTGVHIAIGTFLYWLLYVMGKDFYKQVF